MNGFKSEIILKLYKATAAEKISLKCLNSFFRGVKIMTHIHLYLLNPFSGCWMLMDE